MTRLKMKILSQIFCALLLFTGTALGAAFQFGGLRLDTLVVTSSSSTVALTKAHKQINVATGSADQVYKLPNATGLQAGYWYDFINESSGTLKISNNASTQLTTLAQNQSARAVLTNAGSSNGTWSFAKGAGTSSSSGSSSAVVEDTATCTPVPTGYGTVSSSSFKCWRVGDRMHISGGFTIGTQGLYPQAIVLPGAGIYTIDASKLAFSSASNAESEPLGWIATSTANQNAPLLAAASTSTDYLYQGRTLNVGSKLIPNTAAEFSNSVVARLWNVSVPIYGWSNTATPTGTIQGDCLNGTLTADGDYDICTYDTAGASETFTFSAESGNAVYTAEVIAGGGSGGSSTSGGGGGAGGFCRGINLAASNGAISLTVGSGGTGNTGSGVGNDGTDSTFGSTTAKGGGKGGYPDGSANANGSDGGTGGGGGDDSSVNPGGATNQAVTSGGMVCFGYAGGTSYGASPYNAGGGGGSMEPGETVGSSGGGKGGDGRTSVITGVRYAGGGGGGAGSSGGNHGVGGAGGGGNAGSPTRGCPGANGSAYGAGGGGGGRSCSGTSSGGDGYKGAVILKWKAR